MAFVKHRHDMMHRGLVPEDQLASGTATAGYVPKATGTGEAEWGADSSDLTSLHVDLSVSGAHTVDRDDGATHDLTLTGNSTLTPDAGTAFTPGDAVDLRLLIHQDGTGGWTLAWGGTISWVGGSAPTMPTAANALLTVGLLSVDDGATWLGYAVTDPVLGLDDLSDVTITTPAEGDALVYDGAEWVNTPITTDPGEDTHVWMPLTTIIDGVPELVWDEPSLSLIPTLTPLE